MSASSIQYLRCTIRRNATGAVATIRFLIKCKEVYSNHFRYFVAVCAHRTGGSPELVEFYHLDRAYDDTNAERLAKLRGKEVVCDEAVDYQKTYGIKIREAVEKFLRLCDRFAPTTLSELVGNRDMNLDDADTINSFNLSQCSGDTESEMQNRIVETLMADLGFDEPTNYEQVDEYNDAINDFSNDITNSEITYRMPAAKYPEAAGEPAARRLEIWGERTAELRARFHPPPAVPDQ